MHIYILKDLNNARKAAAPNNANKKVIYKTCAPFNNYTRKKIHKYIIVLI